MLRWKAGFTGVPLPPPLLLQLLLEAAAAAAAEELLLGASPSASVMSPELLSKDRRPAEAASVRLGAAVAIKGGGAPQGDSMGEDALLEVALLLLPPPLLLLLLLLTRVLDWGMAEGTNDDSEEEEDEDDDNAESVVVLEV